MNLKSTLRKGVVFLLICCSLFSFCQIPPDFEGDYEFKNNNTQVFIFNKNRFLAVGYATAVLGTVELKSDRVYFIVDHPKDEFQLYGRRSGGVKQLVIDESLFKNGVFIGMGAKDETPKDLKQMERDGNDYCRSNVFALPLPKNIVNIDLKVDNNQEGGSFKLINNSDELLPVFLKKDPDVSFLNDQIIVKKGKIIFDQTIIKRPLNLTGDIKKIIDEIELVDAVFNKDYIYLNAGYKVIPESKINLKNYSYSKSRNEYLRNEKSEDLDVDFNTVYKYEMIKAESEKLREYQLDQKNVLQTNCLVTPSAVLEEKRDDEYRKRNPREPLKIIPPQPLLK